MTKKHYAPITPGEMLQEEFLLPMGISQAQLARDIDVPVSRVSDIINGKRDITADTAMRLSEYFGNTAQFWLNLQNRYDLEVLEDTTWPATKKRIRHAPVVQAARV